MLKYAHSLRQGFQPRTNFWLFTILAFVSIETMERAGLAIWVGFLQPEDLPALLDSLPVGFLNDLSTGILVGIPFLVGFILLGNFVKFRWVRYLLHVIFFSSLFSLLMYEVAEYVFWNEFDSRMNSIAVFYLMFPREVLGNIKESFDLQYILPPILIVTLVLYLKVFRNRLDRAISGQRPDFDLRLPLAGLVMAALGVNLGHMSLESNSREVEEIAKNGVSTFIRAAVTNDMEYTGIYSELPEDAAEEMVKSEVRADGSLLSRNIWNIPTERHVPAHSNGSSPENTAKRLNVVLVLEESFGMTYMDGFRAKDDHGVVAPNLRELIKGGLYFKNIYATGNRTVRALEAVLTSFPPIPGISTARRNGPAGMNSLPFFLRQQGYQTAMLYGGRALFDNMGTFWEGIGFEDIFDVADIEEPGFTTIWGSADEYLFTEAIRRMDEAAKQEKPYFLTLLTGSNHRPYVYPAGRIDRDPEEKVKENSAAYADWAFADFLNRAKSHDWFDSTIFVFVGDHGPRANGRAMIPVASYRVPLLFYSPANIEAEEIETLGSSTDVGPTLLGLLNLDYESPFFGQDLRRLPPGKGRAFFEHNYSIGMADPEHVTVLVPNQEPRGYKMSLGPSRLAPVPAPDPDLLRRTEAVFQVAHHMFYNHRYHQLNESLAY